MTIPRSLSLYARVRARARLYVFVLGIRSSDILCSSVSCLDPYTNVQRVREVYHEYLRNRLVSLKNSSLRSLFFSLRIIKQITSTKIKKKKNKIKITNNFYE